MKTSNSTAISTHLLFAPRPQGEYRTGFVPACSAVLSTPDWIEKHSGANLNYSSKNFHFPSPSGLATSRLFSNFLELSRNFHGLPPWNFLEGSGNFPTSLEGRLSAPLSLRTEASSSLHDIPRPSRTFHDAPPPPHYGSFHHLPEHSMVHRHLHIMEPSRNFYSPLFKNNSFATLDYKNPAGTLSLLSFLPTNHS